MSQHASFARSSFVEGYSVQHPSVCENGQGRRRVGVKTHLGGRNCVNCIAQGYILSFVVAGCRWRAPHQVTEGGQKHILALTTSQPRRKGNREPAWNPQGLQRMPLHGGGSCHKRNQATSPCLWCVCGGGEEGGRLRRRGGPTGFLPTLRVWRMARKLQHLPLLEAAAPAMAGAPPPCLQTSPSPQDTVPHQGCTMPSQCMGAVGT